MYNYKVLFNNALYMLDETITDDTESRRMEILECPLCGAELVITGRCKTCYMCGWSSCDL